MTDKHRFIYHRRWNRACHRWHLYVVAKGRGLSDVDVRHLITCLWRVPVTLMVGIGSAQEIIRYKQEAEHARPVKYIFGRALPLRRLLQLFIAAANILGRVERIGREPIDVSRLNGQVVGQRGLKFGYLDQGTLRGSAPGLSARTSRTIE